MPSSMGGRLFLRQFFALFAAGLAGIAMLPSVLAPIIQKQLEPAFRQAPELAKVPLEVWVLLSLVQPLILMLIAIGVGTCMAPTLGLRSSITAWAAGAPAGNGFRAEVVTAVLVGGVTAVITVLLDFGFKPFLGEAWQKLDVPEAAPITQTLAGILYGGITEELMMRWGLMTFLVWVGWKLFQRSKPAPGAPVVWGAIPASAAVFGLGHLPAMSAIVPLTPVIVLRTVLLNSLAGVAFGWLYWRKSLEAGMVAHAGCHVVFAAAALFTA